MASYIVNQYLKNNKNKLQNSEEESEKIPMRRKGTEIIPRKDPKVRRTNSEQKYQNRKVRMKCLTTFMIYFCSFVFGIATYINALTLMELKEMLNTSIEKISIVFTIFSISSMIGSIISGVLFNLFGRQICAVIFLIVIGLSDGLSPYSPSVWLLFALTVFKGISCGGFKVAQIVWIIEIWKHESVPYVQALFFCISLGSFITPLVNKQYLMDDKNYYCLNSKKSQQDLGLFRTNYSEISQLFGNYSVKQILPDFPKLFNNSFSDYYQLILETNTNNISNIRKTENVIETCDKKLLLNIPYACEGFLALCGSAIMFIILIDQKGQEKRGSLKRHKHRLLSVNRLLSDGESMTSVKSWRRNFFTISGSILLSAYIAMEFANFQLLANFLRHSDLNLSGPDIANVMLALFGSFTLFRFISIFISPKLKPQIMLFINFVLIIISNIILLIFGDESFHVMVFASILLGAGLSSTIPSIYSFLEQYIHINNNIGSIFIFFGGLMSAINTAIIGRFIDKNLLFFLSMNIFSIIIAAVMVIIIWCSKCLVSSGSYEVNAEPIRMRANIEIPEDDEYLNTFVSNCSYNKKHSQASDFSIN